MKTSTDSTIDLARLRECPFCGGTPKITYREGLGCFCCPEGSTCSGSGIYTTFQQGHEEAAIAWWNQRALLPELEGLRAERDRYLDAIFKMADDGWLAHGVEGMSEAQEAVYEIAQKHPTYKERAATDAAKYAK